LGEEEKMDKRFSLVLDQECMEILDLVPGRQRADFVREAIKHYSTCRRLEDNLNRLEKAIQQVEAGERPIVAPQGEMANQVQDETQEKLLASMNKFLNF